MHLVNGHNQAVKDDYRYISAYFAKMCGVGKNTLNNMNNTRKIYVGIIYIIFYILLLEATKK